MEPTDQERGRHPAPLQRPRDSQQVIPAALDQLAADTLLQPRPEIRVSLVPVEAIELLADAVRRRSRPAPRPGPSRS